MSQKVLVAGTGKSGIAAAKLLLAMGGEVVLYDGNDKLDPEKIKENFEEDAKVTIVLGELTRPDLLGVELSIISPGIPLDAPFVPVLDEAKIPIWSEIQLAYHVAKGKLIAITGTNGKTTTTALTGAIMKTFFDEVFVVGNIGIPYTDVALDTTDKSVTVAEVSSFQLETIMDFHPDVSAILNITPDHLNRHGTMENYIEVKERVAVNQTEDDCIVLNYDDKVLREFGEKKDLKPKVIFFSSTQTLKEGMYLDGDMMLYAHDGKKEEVLNVKTDMQLLGKHNYENVMAAVAMSIRMGVPMDLIRKAVKEFKAVEHRIEFVLERSGVRYYNDSIATSPTRTIAGLRAFPHKVVLIAGGYDKHIPFAPLAPEVVEHVKTLILCGATADAIERAVVESEAYETAAERPRILRCKDLREAVDAAYFCAESGDVVTLSPACAAFDCYANFMERGRAYKEMVKKLGE